MPPPRSKRNLDIMAVSHLGMSLAVSVALFTYGGYRLDLWLDTSPAFLITGAFLGLGSGMWSAVRTIDRLGKDPPPERKDAPDDAS